MSAIGLAAGLPKSSGGGTVKSTGSIVRLWLSLSSLLLGFGLSSPPKTEVFGRGVQLLFWKANSLAGVRAGAAYGILFKEPRRFGMLNCAKAGFMPCTWFA
jgi:hypothetical protein